MSCCNSRHLQYCVLSDDYQKSSLLEVRKELSSFMNMRDIDLKNSLYFSKEGKLFPEKPEEVESGFKLTPN